MLLKVFWTFMSGVANLIHFSLLLIFSLKYKKGIS